MDGFEDVGVRVQTDTRRDWMKWSAKAAKRPAFAAAMHEARVAAGGPFNGRRSTYCVETAQAIFSRLCEGEGRPAARRRTIRARRLSWRRRDGRRRGPGSLAAAGR